MIKRDAVFLNKLYLIHLNSYKQIAQVKDYKSVNNLIRSSKSLVIYSCRRKYRYPELSNFSSRQSLNAATCSCRSSRGTIRWESRSGNRGVEPFANPHNSLKQCLESSIKFQVDIMHSHMGRGKGSLFFYNPATSTSFWDASRQVICVIGHHVFAK